MHPREGRRKPKGNSYTEIGSRQESRICKKPKQTISSKGGGMTKTPSAITNHSKNPRARPKGKWKNRHDEKEISTKQDGEEKLRRGWVFLV